MDNRLQESILDCKEMFGIKKDVIEKEREALEKKQLEMETKADEVMHTTNTGYGEELIPLNVLGDPVLDQLYKYSQLLPMLPGFHGNNMAISEKVPVIGEATLMVPNTEYTTGSPVPYDPTANEKINTGEVSITQGQLRTNINISKRELNYAVGNIEAFTRDRLNRTAARTFDAAIINGDSATSGNVNYDGGTPSTTTDYYTQFNNGIRDKVIADTNTTDVGTLGEQDFINMLDLVEDYGVGLDDLLFVLPRNVYHKTKLLDNVISVDRYGPDATIRSGRLGEIFGIDVAVARDFPKLAQASGKVSSTGGSNTLGSMGIIYKPAVQWGFGQQLEFEPYRIPGKGMGIVATAEMGYGIAYETAGLDKTMAMGINVTVS